MAKKTRGISNRDSQKQKQSKQKSSTSHDSAKKKHTKHTKSSTTDNNEADNEDDGSSVTEAGDVFTLSGARGLDGDAIQRLAGKDFEGQELSQFMFATDAAQAFAGAEDDGVASDNGYADVDNVSDSDASQDEEHERKILRSAEQDLMKEFELFEEKRNASSMMFDMNAMALQEEEAIAGLPNLERAGSPLPDLGLDVNMNDDPFLGLAQNDTAYADLWNEAESALWRMPETIRAREGSEPFSANQKRVRFEEVTHSRRSSTSSSEDANEVFPDLFAAADDPAVQQQLALGLEWDGAHQMDYDDTESFYDFEGDEEKLAFELDEESDSDDDSSSYDSDDEGDTTDEETPDEQITRMKEIYRAAGEETGNDPKTPKRSVTIRTPETSRPVTPKDCKGPKTGKFAVDPTRSTVTSDSRGKQIKMFPPSNPREEDKAFWERAKSANNSRNNSPSNNTCLTLPSPGADNMPARPFTAQSTLGSMFNGNLEILRNNDVAGIAEDMFPHVMQSSQTSVATPATEDSDAEFQNVNMRDFIDLEGSESDSDRPQSASITSPAEPDMYSSFTSEIGRLDGQGSGLLDHFDLCRGTIGSFRRNQNQAKYLSSLSSNPAKRASTHEYNALQKGRRGAANTPMTPARKKRASQDLTQSNTAGIRKSMNSPLASRRPRSRGNSLVNANADIYQTLTRSPFE